MTDVYPARQNILRRWDVMKKCAIFLFCVILIIAVLPFAGCASENAGGSDPVNQQAGDQFTQGVDMDTRGFLGSLSDWILGTSYGTQSWQCQKSQFQQYTGASEQGDTPKDQGGRHLSKSGILFAAGDGVSDGILGGLVGYQIISERRVAQLTR